MLLSLERLQFYHSFKSGSKVYRRKMKFKQWAKVMLLLAVILQTGCFDNSIILVDEYRIYPQDEFGEGYYLICKLGCKESPKIQNITSVQWNDRFIFISKKDNKRPWYVIKAKGKKLKYCSGDILKGPLSEQDLKDYFENEDVGILKEKSFE